MTSSDVPEPLSPPTTHSTLSSGRLVKKRRVQNSSEDTVTTTNTGLSTVSNISQSGFTAEKYRAGAPPLELLPLISSQPSDELEHDFGILVPNILAILKDKSITVIEESIQLVYRHSENDEQPENDDNLTVLVRATWSKNADSQWIVAVDAILEYLLGKHLSYKIEIISWQADTPRYVRPLEFAHPLVSVWDSFNPELMRIVSSSERLRFKWSTMDMLRIGWGYTARPGYNASDDFPVTILITVDWEVDPHDWRKAEAEILALIYRYHFSDVKVEFQRGEMSFCAGFTPFKCANSLLRPNSGIKGFYTHDVRMGSDVGPPKDHYITPSGIRSNGYMGTLGGYVIGLHKTGFIEWFLVTNYHVIRRCIEGWGLTDEDGESKEKKPGVGSALHSKISPRSNSDD